jgi:hypothetical protein
MTGRMPSDGKSSHCLWQGELIIKTGGLICIHLVYPVLVKIHNEMQYIQHIQQGLKCFFS